MAAFDVLVIGSGPGGYVAAIRAQQAGLTAACIEKEKLGGVCLNWGCIPSKALLKAAEHSLFLKDETAAFGLACDNPRHDYAAVVKRSRRVADQSERGVKFLFQKYGVTSIAGTATIESASASGGGTVSVTTKAGVEVHEAKHIIIATGARARTFPGITPDGEKILTYREAIASPAQPKSAIVLGSGAIGLEFAYFWNAFGTEVTVVEGAARLCPLEDGEVSTELAKAYKKLGIKTAVGTFCKSVTRDGDGVVVTLQDGRELRAEVCLIAVGIAPNTEGLGLDKVGIQLEKGFIAHDSSYRTNVPGFYAIGDVCGGPALAHTAYAEAHTCIDRIAGKHSPDVDYGNMPAATYCQPQIASVGLTEEAAKAKGLDFTVGRYPFSANGKARGTGHTDGFVKVLVAKKYGEILGAHIIGHDASELLSTFVMARAAEMTAEAFLHVVFAHPTMGEAMYEAVAVALGKSAHI
ncbi:MAG: dihydrolipoyl dehydrogenase [Pseudomonadota bacterium]|nr:dihydrolipoyl dehydrogenase [Pseudomonadota bacterium]